MKLFLEAMGSHFPGDGEHLVQQRFTMISDRIECEPIGEPVVDANLCADEQQAAVEQAREHWDIIAD